MKNPDNFYKLLASLPKFNGEISEKIKKRNASLTKPLGSLGKLENLAQFIGGWQANEKPCADNAKTLIFAASHGICEQKVTNFPSCVNQQMIENFKNKGAAINQICEELQISLDVLELNLETPSQDFSQQTALTEKQVVGALAYGFSAATNQADIICLGEMGIGNTTTAAMICMALYGGEARQWCGYGTNYNDEKILNRKIQVLEITKNRIIQKFKNTTNHANNSNPTLFQYMNENIFTLLQEIGGEEIIALIGAIVGARLLRIPVVLDGFVVSAAAAIIHKIKPESTQHCLAGHLSKEKAHRKVLQKIKLSPILNLEMRLGEASGATLAIPIIRSALAIQNKMATFNEAGVNSA